MFSKIITVLFAVNVISAANGFINSKLRALEPIVKCHKTNAPEFAGEKAMAARLNLDSDADNLKLFCLTVGEYDTCLADVLKKTPPPVPKAFLVFAAEAYQISYLVKKAFVCPGIKYDDLKRIVLDSGIMKKKGLSNIENDRYHKCAGDTVKKCFIRSMQVFELEEGDPEAGDHSDDAYVRCIEEQTKTCNHPIMRHLFEQTEAFKKDLKQLEMLESEEQHG